jgi:hypothetical protein
MEKFTVHEFEFGTRAPNGDPGPWRISSVVVSPEEFADLMETLRSNRFKNNNGREIDMKDIQVIEEARHIPMVYRGTVTRFLFERYGVHTNYMSVIVRGSGVEVYERYMCETLLTHDPVNPSKSSHLPN